MKYSSHLSAADVTTALNRLKVETDQSWTIDQNRLWLTDLGQLLWLDRIDRGQWTTALTSSG